MIAVRMKNDRLVILVGEYLVVTNGVLLVHSGFLVTAAFQPGEWRWAISDYVRDGRGTP